MQTIGGRLLQNQPSIMEREKPIEGEEQIAQSSAGQQEKLPEHDMLHGDGPELQPSAQIIVFPTPAAQKADTKDTKEFRLTRMPPAVFNCVILPVEHPQEQEGDN